MRRTGKQSPELPADASEGPVDVILKKYIGATGIAPAGFSASIMDADIYHADVDAGDGVRHGLVVKVIDRSFVPRALSGGVEWGFENEAHNHDLSRKAQGLALPRFAGLFVSGSLLCLVFDDAGRRLTTAEYRSRVVL